MASKKTFAQRLLGTLRDVLEATLDLLGDPDARGGAGLNPDATPDATTAQDVIARIGDYFNSDNPSGEQYLAIVNDVIKARDLIKDLVDQLRFNDSLSGTALEMFQMIVGVAGLNVVRGKFPYIYYLARLLAFVDDAGVVQTIHKLQLDRLDRLFQGTPGVTYYKDVLAALPNDQARVDFTLGAAGAVLKALSFLPFIGNNLNIRVFYGWDAIPGPVSGPEQVLERSLSVALSKPRSLPDCTTSTFTTCDTTAAPPVDFTGALILNALKIPAEDSASAGSGVLGTAQLDGQFTIDIPHANSATPRGKIVIDTSGPAVLNFLVGDSVSLVPGVVAPSLSVEFHPTVDPADEPQIVIGSDKGTRLEIGRISLRSEIRPESGAVNYGVRLALEDSDLVVVPGEGDGFLNTILGALTTGGELKVGFSLAIGVQKGLGFFIEGGTGLRVTLALGKQLGPVRLESLTLAIDAKTGDDKKFALSTGIAATLSFKTTGVSVTVDQMGLTWKLVPLRMVILP